MFGFKRRFSLPVIGIRDVHGRSFLGDRRPARSHCQMHIPIAIRAIRCHRGIVNQALTIMPGASISTTMMPKTAPICFTASLGFPMPSIISNAIRTDAIVASDPRMTAHPCIRLDSLILALPFCNQKLLSREILVECADMTLSGKCPGQSEAFPAGLSSS
jgi:hypothetical protein